jgi:chlorite dismutase
VAPPEAAGQSASPAGRPATGQAAEPAKPKAPRQWVNFAMFKLDPAVRRLDSASKRKLKSQFLKAYEKSRPPEMLLHAYSLTGLRRDVDFMLWRISYNIEDLQAHTAALNAAALGGYLNCTYSMLSMTKRSIYLDKLDPGHAESRLRICPGRCRYLFVYPFVKTRPWYLLSVERRQAMMDQHIIVGNRYPGVKLHTTYSFGLDDQEFVVAFETDDARDFLDLVQELRETQASEYTLRDTPMFTGLHAEMGQILDQLL